MLFLYYKSVFCIADDSHIYKTCREIVFYKCIINNSQKTAKTEQRNISKYFDKICTKMETESLKSYDFTVSNAMETS